MKNHHRVFIFSLSFSQTPKISKSRQTINSALFVARPNKEGLLAKTSFYCIQLDFQNYLIFCVIRGGILQFHQQSVMYQAPSWVFRIRRPVLHLYMATCAEKREHDSPIIGHSGIHAEITVQDV